MDNRTLTIFSLLIGSCIAILFAVQYLPLIWAVETEPFVTHNGTKGIALEKGGKLWTLSFDQQNAFIDALNEGEQIDKAAVQEDTSLFPFGRLIVYQFDKPDLIFIPVNVESGDIFFSAPGLVKDAYIREESEGKLLELLSHAYDQ